MNSGDTAWLLVSAALVMLMTPGLALFYGGMVQGKNVLSTLMHSFFALGIISVQFAIIGYSLCFGASWHGVVGGLDYVGLSGVGDQAFDAGHAFPMLAHFAYQCMFAVITPALISGAYAERMKFSAYVVFTLAWSTLVYDPIAHWVWQSDGWLAKLGAIDFAGGTVVHFSSGVSALICAIVLGKRRGYPSVRHPPHDLTLTVIGAGILWFGWFGFNAGSALHADGLASLAFVNTHLAAAAGALTWALTEALRAQKATMLGVASGLVAGLVAITPAAGYISPMAAIGLGAAAGIICYGGVLLKTRLGYDDALDAFGVHGVGGATGALATGLLARAALNNGHGGGLELLGKQALGLAAAGVWAALLTFVLLKVIDAALGLRVDAETEHDGLDGALHGESAYGSPGSVAHGS
jgi:ammonium transporter, Amt family